MASLVDGEQTRVGAITVLESHTVKPALLAPDITFIPAMADYPAGIVHSSHNPDDMPGTAVGTGAHMPENVEVGVKAVVVKNPNHTWWGHAALPEGGSYPDRIEFIDYGTDPSAFVAAAEADEIDALWQTVGDFVDVMDGPGWGKSGVSSGATIVIRPNQLAEVDGKMPYADKRVRQALPMAVDNNVCLELGYSGLGMTANNHHAGPMHPEYDPDTGRLPFDPVKAMQLMKEAGMEDYEHELHSIDDDWRKNTTDSVAAQLRAAGFKVKRTTLSGGRSGTTGPNTRSARPTGFGVWPIARANDEFDALPAEANAIADADARRVVASKIQALIAEEGVTIQPCSRNLYRHTNGKTAAHRIPASCL
jgi:peptide/nickel transport system substrate-binding protein